MTGPLAQQIAQVRDFLNTGGFGIDRTRELLAALSAIERHVQDMQKLVEAGDDEIDRLERHVQDMETALRAAEKLAADPFGHLSERKFYALREALTIRDATWRFRKSDALPASGTRNRVAREKEEGEFRITPGQAKTLDKAGDS